MGLLDKLFNKDPSYDDWSPAFRGVLVDLTYDDLVDGLGSSTKAKDGFVYWRGPMSKVDPDLPKDEYFQVSNQGFGFGKPRSLDSDSGNWYVLATSEKAIRQIASELGCVVRGVEATP